MEWLISQSLLEILKGRYGLIGVRGARLLEGGERNQVLRLECERGAFVLRISPPDTTVESLAYEHALMGYMHGHLLQVPRPIAGRDGSTWFLYGDQPATLFPFMLGEIADRDPAQVRHEAARVLARIHQAALHYPDRSARPGYPSLQDLDWEANCAWSWPAVRAFLVGGASGPGGTLSDEPPEVTAGYKREIGERLPQIEQERDNVRCWAAQLATSGRALHFAPIHGDYYRVPFIRCTRLIEVLSDLGNAVRGQAWDAGYTLHNLIALENLHSPQSVEG